MERDKTSVENVRMEYWTTTWCGPCRSIKPIINELKEAGWNIEIIDADQNRDKSIANQIAGVPTFIVYKNEVQVSRFTGARPKAAILSELTRAAGK